MLVMVVFFIAFRWIHLSTPLIRLFLLVLILLLIDRKSGSAGMPRPISYAVFCLKKKKGADLLKTAICGGGPAASSTGPTDTKRTRQPRHPPTARAPSTYS